MRLRNVATGWVRAAFFAALALVVFLLCRKLMGRSPHAFAAFAYTFLGLAALPVVDELRRKARRAERGMPLFEVAPPEATYEHLFSLAALAWPSSLLIWVLLPAASVAAAANFAVGQWVNDVAGSMGSVAAVVVGALAGLAAWMALRTVSLWRLSESVDRWPLWVEAPPTSLSFRSLVLEWRRQPIYYFEPPAGRFRS